MMIGHNMLTALQPRDPWAPPFAPLPLSCFPSGLEPLYVGPRLWPLIFGLWDCSQKIIQSLSDLCLVSCCTLIFWPALQLWLWLLLLWSTGVAVACCSSLPTCYLFLSLLIYYSWFGLQVTCRTYAPQVHPYQPIRLQNSSSADLEYKIKTGIQERTKISHLSCYCQLKQYS